MLDKELDKLRDKTISFWCVIMKEDWTSYRTSWIWWAIPVNNRVLGHPLTRWRIEHYYRNHGTDYQFTQIYNAIKRYFEYNWETAFGQSELERQTHEKRSELKELLIQFSNYL